MTHPTLHRNGTGRDDLARQYKKVISALDTLLDAMQAAAPNGRDYYPQGDKIILLALREHHTRVVVLEKMQQVYEDLLDHVLED